MKVSNNNRCSHEVCAKRPLVDVDGIHRPLRCKQHPEDGIVNVDSNRCSHKSCTGLPRWGYTTDVSASVCSRHKNNLTAGLVIDFNRKCDGTGCRLMATWGLDEALPTHCHDHGRLRDELSHIVEADHGESALSSSSFGPDKAPSFRVKAECLY